MPKHTLWIATDTICFIRHGRCTGREQIKLNDYANHVQILTPQKTGQLTDVYSSTGQLWLSLGYLVPRCCWPGRYLTARWPKISFPHTHAVHRNAAPTSRSSFLRTVCVWARAFRLASSNEQEEVFSLDRNPPSFLSHGFQTVCLFL